MLRARFSFRWTGAALAAAVMAFPLMVRAIRLSLESDEHPARTGRPHARRGLIAHLFATVTLPLALPGILAGLILGFAKAIGEFGATITFVANIPGQTQTLATAIYSATQDPAGEPTTWRLTGDRGRHRRPRAAGLGGARAPHRGTRR